METGRSNKFLCLQLVKLKKQRNVDITPTPQSKGRVISQLCYNNERVQIRLASVREFKITECKSISKVIKK